MLSIKHLEAIPLNVPFYHERVSRHMHRALTHGERVHIYRVELSNGVVGYGENLGDESATIEQVIGQNAFACMNDDSIGFGIQMSLFDAIGKSVNVPVYQLIGPKVRERCPISWWDIDMPPEDWVAEVQESVKRGYTSAKLKARPWRDIFAQVNAVGDAVPSDYRLDIDFNGFLRTADNAIPVLQQLDEHPNVAIYESPYYLGTDVIGAARLQAAVQKRIVEHFNESCLHARCWRWVCSRWRCEFTAPDERPLCVILATLLASDGRHRDYNRVPQSISVPCLSQAQLPAITCHELWESDLLETPLAVVDGTLAVSDAPGLGISVDEAALTAYRVEPSTPTPQQLFRESDYTCRVHIPDGSGGETVHDFSGEDVYYPAFSEGAYPGFVPGVWMEVV